MPIEIPECDMEPQTGSAIVLKQVQDKSAGGVVLAGETVEIARYHVVKASNGYTDHGRFVESDLQPGDEVVLYPKGFRDVIGPNNKPARIPATRLTSSPLLPSDCYLVFLEDISGRVPRDKVQPVVGSPRIQVAPASVLQVVKH